MKKIMTSFTESISSLVMTLFNVRNTLELHHTPQSFSKFFFSLMMFLPQKKKTFFNTYQ